MAACVDILVRGLIIGLKSVVCFYILFFHPQSHPLLFFFNFAKPVGLAFVLPESLGNLFFMALIVCFSFSNACLDAAILLVKNRSRRLFLSCAASFLAGLAAAAALFRLSFFLDVPRRLAELSMYGGDGQMEPGHWFAFFMELKIFQGVSVFSLSLVIMVILDQKPLRDFLMGGAKQ